MGAYDIMPFTASRGGHHRQIALPVGANTTAATANTSWLTGEILEITYAEDAGDVDVTPDGSALPNTGLIYIAAGSSEGILQSRTGALTAGGADGLMAPCWVMDHGTEFVTRNAFNNNDTNVGPAGSGAMTGVGIGVTCGLWRDNTNPGTVSGDVNGDMGIDVNTTSCVVTRLLDVNNQDTSVSGGDTDKIVFMVVNET